MVKSGRMDGYVLSCKSTKKIGSKAGNLYTIRLSKYDRNEVIRIVNDVDESHFWNKQELIEKLWYYGKN